MSTPFSLGGRPQISLIHCTSDSFGGALHAGGVIQPSHRWMMPPALAKVTKWTSHHLSVIVNLAVRPPRLFCMHVLAPAPTLLTIMWPTPSCSPPLCVGRQVPMGETML